MQTRSSESTCTGTRNQRILLGLNKVFTSLLNNFLLTKILEKSEGDFFKF